VVRVVEVGITHLWVVIWAADPLVANIAIRTQAFRQIGLTIIMKRFSELLGCAAHVTQVYKEDLLLLSEMADGSRQIVGHQGEVSLTKPNTIGRTGNQVDHSLVVFKATHDACHTADGRQGRVVRMHSHFDISSFGNRYHALQKVFQVLPLIFLSDNPVFSLGLVAQLVVVIAGYLSTTARRDDM